MGTPCDIAIEHPDGTLEAVYVNYDGYLSYMGPLLLQHYGARQTINDLMALGNFSSLAETLGESTAYMRDRGEDGEESQVFDNVISFRGIHGSFIYVYGQDDIWYYLSADKGRIPLSVALAFLAKDDDFY